MSKHAALREKAPHNRLTWTAAILLTAQTLVSLVDALTGLVDGLAGGLSALAGFVNTLDPVLAQVLVG